MPVLELKNIHKSYFLGKEEFPVLNGIDLSIDRGDFVSLLGESGGGKSTLMNIIGGLDREYTGDVIVDGVVQRTKKERAMDAYRRDTIGFIFQSFNLVSYLSVIDNIMISLKMTALTEKERHERAIELTKQVGLYDHRKKKPAQLSGGQKQRVAIARALASDPEIILADEPTGALDSQNTKEVLAILREIAQSGKTVIVVTHSQEVADYGTRIIHLADGHITGDERIKPTYPIENVEKPFKTKALAYRDVIRTAAQHFAYSWKLNLLIALGTAIGLFSVIFFLGLGTGATKYMNDQVTSLANPNAIQVLARSSSNQSSNNQTAFANAQQAQTPQSISNTEMNQLAAVKNVKNVTPMYVMTGKFSATTGTSSISNESMLSWSELFQSSVLVAGKAPGKNEVIIQEKDVQNLDATAFQKQDWKAVIGKTLDLTMTIMNGTTPVTIHTTLKISGVIQPIPGTTSWIASPDTMKSILSSNSLSTDPQRAVVVANDSHNVKSVVGSIQAIKTDGKLTFATTSISSELDTINNITSIVSTVLAAIAGISLIVSIFMIVVTTYMSVAERTKEIGVIRALGGRRKDISRLFTAESIILGLSSAAIAIVLAYLGQLVLNAALHSLVGGNIIDITPGHVIFAIIIAVLIALLASLAPSGRAARLNTIEALAAE